MLELTGTPGDKLMDLWAQIYLLDGGKRLGRTITEYRNRWFVPDKNNGYVVYSYKPKLELSRRYMQQSVILLLV